jgi:hypothetical protein
MIYSLLESSMRCVIEREENINEDGSINWNFVDADAYWICSEFFKDSEAFYEAFDEIANVINSERTSVETAEQLEFVLH